MRSNTGTNTTHAAILSFAWRIHLHYPFRYRQPYWSDTAIPEKKKAHVFPMPGLCFHFQGAAYSSSLCLTLCHPFLADFNLYHLMVTPEFVKLFTSCLSPFSLISTPFIQQRPHSWKQYLSTLHITKQWLKYYVTFSKTSLGQNTACHQEF